MLQRDDDLVLLAFAEDGDDRFFAERGGLQQGDVIKEVNLNPVHNSAGLQEQISRLRPGEKAVVTVLREGKQHEIIVAL